MKSPTVVAMVVQNDSETVRRSVESFYPHVDRLFISNDPTHGWSGKAITPDGTLDILREIDAEKKITFISGDFHSGPTAMQNDTAQRQFTVRQAEAAVPEAQWIIQIDADEQFLDFPFLLQHLHSLPWYAQQLHWKWVPIFNRTEDGRYLVVTKPDGTPQIESFPVAHRPWATLRECRHIIPDYRRYLYSRILRRVTRKSEQLEFYYPEQYGATKAALHFTFAKSEARIREKLFTWSHTADLDPAAFFELWKNSKMDWSSMRDFHPLNGPTWPRLNPFTLEELMSQVSSPASAA